MQPRTLSTHLCSRSTLQHTATLYSTLHHTAKHYNLTQHTATHCPADMAETTNTAKHCNVIQRTATHCNTDMDPTTNFRNKLAHAADGANHSTGQNPQKSGHTKFYILLRMASWGSSLLQCVAVCCSVLQCVVLCCSVLQ